MITYYYIARETKVGTFYIEWEEEEGQEIKYDCRFYGHIQYFNTLEEAKKFLEKYCSILDTLTSEIKHIEIEVERDINTIVKREFLKWCLHHNLEMPYLEDDESGETTIRRSETTNLRLVNRKSEHTLCIEVNYSLNTNTNEVIFYCVVEASRKREQDKYLLRDCIKQSFLKTIVIDRVIDKPDTISEALCEALGKYEETLELVVNLAENLEE